MATKLEIFNIALQNVGANRVNSIDADSPEAEECNFRYDHTRRALLEMHSWNFATKRVLLNEQATSPLYGFAKQYLLPADFLRLIATEGDEDGVGVQSSLSSSILPDDYRIEIGINGKKILITNSSAQRIKYIFDQKDEAKFSSTFTELLGRLLGSNIAYKLTQNRTFAREERQFFAEEFKQSRIVDMQQTVQDSEDNSLFVSVRGGGGFDNTRL